MTLPTFNGHWKRWKFGLYAAAFSGGVMAIGTALTGPLAYAEVKWEAILIQGALMFLVGAGKAVHRYMKVNPISRIWEGPEKRERSLPVEVERRKR